MDRLPSRWFSDIFKEITIVQKLSSKKIQLWNRIRPFIYLVVYIICANSVLHFQGSLFLFQKETVCFTEEPGQGSEALGINKVAAMKQPQILFSTFISTDTVSLNWGKCRSGKHDHKGTTQLPFQNCIAEKHNKNLQNKYSFKYTSIK